MTKRTTTDEDADEDDEETSRRNSTPVPKRRRPLAGALTAGPGQRIVTPFAFSRRFSRAMIGRRSFARSGCRPWSGAS